MSKEYDDYLTAHIAAVAHAAVWMTKNLESVRALPAEIIRTFRYNTLNHDASKWDDTEYRPYDAYFYGDEEKDESAFNLAWLHHIHNNPHHWQHWLLVNDDGAYCVPDEYLFDAEKIVVLEMPTQYALEMVADWWSFSWRSRNLMSVFGWYDAHKDCVVLHPKTRAYVESTLDEIRLGLESTGGKDIYEWLEFRYPGENQATAATKEC